MRRRAFGTLALVALAGCVRDEESPASARPVPGTGAPETDYSRPLSVVMDMLRTGGVSLYLAHPGLIGDALSDLGRQVATEVGEAFAALDVEVTVTSSPAQYCLETADVAFAGSEATVDDLLRDLREAEGREEQITEHAAKRLASSVPWGEVAVLIGHPGNITAVTGVPVNEGEGLICARAGGSFQVLAETMPNDWARMK